MYENSSHLKYLKSQDLFAKDRKQIFSAKTGKHVATIDESQLAMFTEPEEAPPAEEPKEAPDPNQLQIF